MKTHRLIILSVIFASCIVNEARPFGVGLLLDRVNLAVWSSIAKIVGVKRIDKQSSVQNDSQGVVKIIISQEGCDQKSSMGNESSYQFFTDSSQDGEENDGQIQKNVSPKNKVCLRDVVGMDDVVHDVTEIIDFLRSPERYTKLGAKLPRGILLEGPPGNGKTMIAKAIANEAGHDFIYASGSSFVEVYVGTGAKRVRELFEAAKKSGRPTIIFIDEFDALAGVSRENSSCGEYSQTINELLCAMDGFDSTSNIIVIAATNCATKLDKAATRSGRFDRIIKVPLPDHDGRMKILQHYVDTLPSSLVTRSDIIELAKVTEGCCAADLKNLVNEAALAAVRSKKTRVEREDFDMGWKKVSQGREFPYPNRGADFITQF